MVIVGNLGHRLPKFTQGKKKDNLKHPVSIKEPELVIKYLPIRKTPCGITGKFYQISKEKNDTDLIKMRSANRRGGNIYNIILRKPEKDINDKNKTKITQ